ncbi:hypothetical protein A3836_11710, partial [Staphylococcus hominis]
MKTLTSYMQVAHDERTQANKKFDILLKKMEELKNIRNEIVLNSNIHVDEKDFLNSYTQREDDNSTSFFINDDSIHVHRKLKRDNLNFDMVNNIFDIRNKLIDIEIENINKENIESSFIFENTFFPDILDDVQFADNNSFNPTLSNIKKKNSSNTYGYFGRNIRLKKENILG